MKAGETPQNIMSYLADLTRDDNVLARAVAYVVRDETVPTDIMLHLGARQYTERYIRVLAEAYQMVADEIEALDDGFRQAREQFGKG